MRKIFATYFVLFFAVTAVSSLFAQDAEKFKINGQIRARYEFDNRNFINGKDGFDLVYLRSRLGVTATPAKGITAVVQVQDARVLGQEANTASNSANVDLKLGYLKFDNFLDLPVDVTMGRFGAAYGQERLIGYSEWNNNSRTFDGLVVSYKNPGFKLDFFYLKLAEKQNYNDSLDNNAIGLYGNIPLAEKSSLQPYVILSHVAPALVDMYTAGAYYTVKTDMGLYADVEGAYQFGKNKVATEYDYAAYMVTAKAGYTFTHNLKPWVEVGADVLSGDDGKDAAKYKSFNTLFGTNHRYYGYMDYFTVFGDHVYGKGLMDMFGTIGTNPHPKFKAAATLHLFNTMEDVTLTGTNTSKALGSEVDILLNYTYSEVVKFESGLSFFAPGDVLKAKKGGDKTTTWFYLSTTVNF